jgi:cell division septation protein DedD
MTDIRAEDAASLDKEDRLPWLEAVEEEGGREGPSPLKLIVAVLIGLAAIGAIVGGVFWMGSRDGAETRDAELIQAPEGDYKVRPDDPGGMAVEGEGDTSFVASTGADPKGQINTNAVPEAPVAKGQAPAAQPQPAPAQPAPKQEPALKAPAPTNAGPAIQLGAFSSQAGASNAWKALSGRFSYLAPLSHSVVPVNSGGKTLYRLRANGPGASNICGRLRVAGESCVQLD